LPDLVQEGQEGWPGGGFGDLVEVAVFGVGWQLRVMRGVVVAQDEGAALEVVAVPKPDKSGGVLSEHLSNLQQLPWRPGQAEAKQDYLRTLGSLEIVVDPGGSNGADCEAYGGEAAADQVAGTSWSFCSSSRFRDW